MFLLLITCKSNQIPSESNNTADETVDIAPQQTPMTIVEPGSINPDDCRLNIKISEISNGIISGTIVEIKERGFGFKDYINNGDSREFKPFGGVNGLKPGQIITGTIRSIGNSRDSIYTLRGIEITK